MIQAVVAVVEVTVEADQVAKVDPIVGHQLHRLHLKRRENDYTYK